ncbi:uncharacterized protein LOC125049747 [Pieris napi]|uniref:uncharacterized protein LOC125049747 n=1 Tax=Pieris napi TaxID=78633 RepID=UPI001FBB4195|nr:uncharacterized protein LOC125049747 [Pieris napi]
MAAAGVLEFNLERSEIEYCNESYIKNLKLAIRKHSRAAKRTLNISAKLLKTLGNNVTVKMSMEEFLHNEYRPTFIHLEFKWCEMLESPYMRLKEKYGIPCPTPPRRGSGAGAGNERCNPVKR